MRAGCCQAGQAFLVSHRRAKRGGPSPGGEGRGSLMGDRLGGGALPCVHSSCAWTCWGFAQGSVGPDLPALRFPEPCRGPWRRLLPPSHTQDSPGEIAVPGMQVPGLARSHRLCRRLGVSTMSCQAPGMPGDTSCWHWVFSLGHLVPIRDRVCPCGSDTPPEPQATDPTLSGTPDYRSQLPWEGSFKTHMRPMHTGMHKRIHMPLHTQAQEQVDRRLCGICRKGLTSPLTVSFLPALPLILVKSNLLSHLEKESNSRAELWHFCRYLAS